MTEEDDVEIKVQETKKIPIDKIQMSNLQVRVTDVTKGLDHFAEQIRKVGLIQPIVVYKKGDSYELLAGQRRFLAHKDILKWKHILAMIIEEPKSHNMKKTISWLENEARKNMAVKDRLKWINELYSQRLSFSDIAKTLGISKDEVKHAIELPRVPDVVREAVQKGEITAVSAVRATDAKLFEKGATPEEKGKDILDLAKTMDTIGKTAAENVASYAINNPNATTTELLTEGVKNTREKIMVELLSNDAKRLDRFAKTTGKASKAEAASDLILQGLDDHGE